MLRGGSLTLVVALLLAGCFGGPATTPAATKASRAPAPGAPADVPAATGATLNLTAASAPAAPLALGDPLANGSFNVTSFEYDEKVALVTEGTLAPAYPARLHGVVFAPQADGAHPLVLLLHGMHQTCDGVFSIGISDACEGPVGTAVPSYRGYDYLAQHLATHGFVVVSIDADQANDRDAAGPFTALGPEKGAGPALRGDLVLQTLDMLRSANADGAGALAPLKGHLDMARIGLMGHSRGGEGVSAAIAQNAARKEPFALKAVFALAPTDFGRHDVRGVPFAVLLPACDGDVSDLEGAILYDDARAEDKAPLHAFLVRGANHNFYNTVWTYDDASGYSKDNVCAKGAPLRLSDAEERVTGVALMGAFFRAYVADELDLMPFLTGDAPLPAAACGAKPCAGLVHVAYQPGAASRALVDNATGDGATNALGGKTSFDGFQSHNVCAQEDAGFPMRAIAKHDAPACPGYDVHEARMHNLSWSGRATWSTDAKGADWSDRRSLALRVAVPIGADAPALSVTLVDAKGGRATLALANATAALQPPESKQHAQTVLRTLRLPLASFGAVDLAHVARVELALDAPHGQIVLTDLAVDR